MRVDCAASIVRVDWAKHRLSDSQSEEVHTVPAGAVFKPHTQARHVVVVVVVVGSRLKRVGPPGQLAQHCAETLWDEEETAQTRLYKSARQDRLNPGGIHKDP